MSDSAAAVADGMVVGIAYELRLEDGEVIDSALSSEPLEYLHGYGNIIQGLEDELQGLKVGEGAEVSVVAAEGYGEVDPEEFLLLPFDAFPENFQLTEGMVLDLRDTETDEAIEARVSQIREDGVLVDLNHPLAGKTLIFDVHIMSVRAATVTELEHGHVHGGQHGH